MFRVSQYDLFVFTIRLRRVFVKPSKGHGHKHVLSLETKDSTNDRNGKTPPDEHDGNSLYETEWWEAADDIVRGCWSNVYGRATRRPGQKQRRYGTGAKG
jgi:hypothetical protein